MIKIYSSGKTIRLISNCSVCRPKFGSILISVSSEKELSESYEKLIKNKEIEEICFCHESESVLFDWFKSMFKIIEAAGGLVKNSEDKYLFIFRKGKWDLPKGKIDKGESIRDAAIREVEEECGIEQLSIVKEIPPTYHTYYIGDKHVLKPTYWFEMNCSDTSELVPQEEEGITEVRWLSRKDLSMVRENTYASILDVFSEL